MTIDQDDIAAIVSAVNENIARRLEDVYGAIEQMREEFHQTITVMDGNDMAIVGELQKMKAMPTPEVLKEAGESWERYVRGEAKHLGLRIIAPKVDAPAVADAAESAVEA